MFPLAFDTATDALVRGDALTGGLLQAISHATAKAAMFMAAGLHLQGVRTRPDRDLAGAVRAVPLRVLAFVIGGVALMGVLPSGAYIAKKLLEAAAATTGQWWWDWVLTAGGFLTASYVVLVTMCTFRARDPGAPVPAPYRARRRSPRSSSRCARSRSPCSPLGSAARDARRQSVRAEGARLDARHDRGRHCARADDPRATSRRFRRGSLR